MPIEAKVEDIYTFYTHLKTRDGGIHIFPNALLLQKAVSVIEEDETKSDDQFPTFNNAY
jgi:small-conductance mechanosensitive channel